MSNYHYRWVADGTNGAGYEMVTAADLWFSSLGESYEVEVEFDGE